MVKWIKFFASITILVIFLDQLTKHLVQQFLPGWDLTILHIQLVKNTGAGFGILQGKTLTLAFISLIVAMGVILYYNKIEKEKIPQILFALFLGGVVGNGIDRFFRGYVIDFIDFSFWPAFNIADSAIVVAVIGLIFFYWKR